MMIETLGQLLGASTAAGAGFVLWSALLHNLIFRDNEFIAKALNSFTYNSWAVVYSGMLAKSLFWRPEFPWLFLDYESDTELVDKLEVLIVVSVGYFVSDMYLDPDPAFVVHHLVSAAAFLLSWGEPTVQTVLTLNVVGAELGGVFYNGAKLFRGTSLQNFARDFQFYAYSFSRLFLMLPWTVYLICSYVAQRRWRYPWGAVAGVSAGGSVCILVLNLKFLAAQCAKRQKQAPKEATKKAR